MLHKMFIQNKHMYLVIISDTAGLKLKQIYHVNEK